MREFLGGPFYEYFNVKKEIKREIFELCGDRIYLKIVTRVFIMYMYVFMEQMFDFLIFRLFKSLSKSIFKCPVCNRVQRLF